MLAFAPDPTAPHDAPHRPVALRPESRPDLRVVPAVTRHRSPGRVPPSTYRRRQALAAALVAAAFAVLSTVLGALGDGPRSVPEPLRVESSGAYVVEPGDTFWSIALRLQPEGDPRPLVGRLMSDHGTPALRAGDVLRLPRA